MNLELANLTGVFQSDELPGLAGVDRFVNAAPENHVRANRFAARPDVNDVRVRV